jgi:hypothetical protein
LVKDSKLITSALDLRSIENLPRFEAKGRGFRSWAASKWIARKRRN